jgi:dTDP-4-amino-4,6-dideoxygalactose transaminase
VILSGWITQGPKVKEFEEKFASYAGVPHAVAVSSCTAALHLSLIVAGIGALDEVICPSMSYIATANSIRYVGARPVFAEVEAPTLNIDPVYAESLITPKTKAILIVHQVGMPADIDTFRKICQEHNLVLIEDAACASGSEYKNRKIGSHSDLVCFSFHPRKVITTGDGGMILTSRQDYHDRLKMLRQHGMSVSDLVRHSSRKVIIDEHLELGYNYRMTDIQAAVGIKQLEKLDWLVSERRKIADRYRQLLGGLTYLGLPQERKGYLSNYQSFQVYLTKDCPVQRDTLMQRMLEKGISTRKGIMTAHRERAYKDLYQGLSLPVSEDLCDRSIILPLYVPMEENTVDFVAQTFKSLTES